MFALAVVLVCASHGSAQNKTYTVQQGDTISEIASHLKVRRAELVAANSLSNSHLLQPGMVLRVPARMPESTPVAAKGSHYYTVRNGDFDWALAHRYNTTISKLTAMNPGVNFKSLQIGTRIAVPGNAPVAATTVKVAHANPKAKTAAVSSVKKSAKVAMRTHKVGSGECDWIIAKHAGVTLSALRAANPGKDLNKIQIGQVLRVPTGSLSSAEVSIAKVATKSNPKTTTKVAAKAPTIKSQYAKVVGDGSIIRRTPGVNAEKVAQVDAGTQVKVLDHDNGWYKLKFPKGAVGWMRGDLLKPVSVVAVAKTKHQERIVKEAPRTRVARAEKPEPRSIIRGSSRVAKGGHPSLAPESTTSGAIKAAYSQLGARYVWGSTSRSNGGYDCSGLVTYAYKSQGVKLPRTSRDMSTAGVHVDKSEMKPGDLVFFNTHRSTRINHVGMYIGNGKFIHSSSGQGGVRIDNINSGYYARKFATSRRVVKSGGTSKVASKKEAPKAEAHTSKPLERSGEAESADGDQH